MRRLFIFASIAFLGACSGNPMDRITKLSDVNVTEDAVSVAVAEATGDADAPLTDVAVEGIVQTNTAPIMDPAAKPGFFARLLGGSPAVMDDVPVEDDIVVVDALTDEAEAVVAVVDGPQVVESASIAVPAPKQAGFFGRLFGGAQTASNASGPASRATPAGLLSSSVRTGPDAQLVTVGTQIPYGEIATNCDVSSRQLGTKVGEASGYTLYDTIPNATALRTHYITGFKDRCARQFTAATSLFGDIGTHEVVRYLPSNSRTPYTVTDAAYETVKGNFCGVGIRQPCGRKLERLSNNTTFITAYRNFGSNPTWSNILLYNGEVVEMGSAAP